MFGFELVLGVARTRDPKLRIAYESFQQPLT
jgi:hypothetical protein